MEEAPITIRTRSLLMYCATLRATTSQLHALIGHNRKFLATLTDAQRKMIVSVSRALRPRAQILREIDHWIRLYEGLWVDALAIADDHELRAVLVLGSDKERVDRLDALRETIRKLQEYEAKLGDNDESIEPECPHHAH